MISPCTLVCSIDLKTGYCFGCGRTRDEIAGWMDYTDIERRVLMEALPARLETVERKPRRETRRQLLAQRKTKERDTA
ncbi:Putative Fe-S protein [Neorhizobium galegae bv. orientalis]|uniref:Putative Fe-S protein n=1 Tax=Neorhizobium galegae bv. officinalis TaxID=323656 RepID=A0A0T7H0W4_NEOGA|nr:DUF1289 domain-containing protein [Neorhizobium galegae]CDZ53165.1 Putative Fe-S protein [Neorhizobium galegae bv. officinalis]CDZ60076.1 Putative Fe-S protein [Neorhizobium galegae bv. orientalis]